MENIKKLIYKGFYKSMRILVIVLIVISAFIAVLSFSGNEFDKADHTYTMVIIGLVIFNLVLLATIGITYIKTKKRYKKFVDYLDEHGLSAEEDFEKLGKTIYISKNMIIDTMNSYSATIHMNMIESYEKSVMVMGKASYLTVEIKLYGEKKTQHCFCFKPEIQSALIERINERKGIIIPEEEKDLRTEKSKAFNAVTQEEPKKVYGVIAVIIIMAVVTGLVYYFVQSSKEESYISGGNTSGDVEAPSGNNQPNTDQSYQYLKLTDEKDDDYIDVGYDGEKGDYTIYLYNTSSYLFEGTLIISDESLDEEKLEVVGLSPGGYWESDVSSLLNEPSEYEFKSVKFYESDQVSAIQYKRHFGFNEEERNIAIKGDMMTVENIESILLEEKSYVEREGIKKGFYYFHDVEPEYLEEYYPDDETRVYRGIIDTETNEIRIYEYNQGEVGDLISTIKY